MADLTTITDYTEEEPRKVRFRYKSDEVLLAILRTWLSRLQQVENEVFDLYEAMNLDNATGDLLQKIAAIVNVEFNGQSDEQLRNEIRTQILIINSEGRASDLYRVAIALQPSLIDLRLTESTNDVRLTTSTSLTVAQGQEVVNTLDDVRALAVQLHFEFPVSPSADTFTFSPQALDGSANSNLGFGDGSTTGGKFAGGVNNG